MGIIRLLIIFIIAYLAVRILRKLFAPKSVNPKVRGQSKPSGTKDQKKDIEDADYEEIE
jgi:hypothetical protein